MELVKIKNKRQFEEYIESISNIQNKRMQLEKGIAVECLKNSENKLHILGYCEVCESVEKLLVDYNYTDNNVPNYRERLVCEKCKNNNRQRFILGYLKKEIANLKQKENIKVYSYEQVTAFYKELKKSLKGIEITGSEFLGKQYKSGEIVNGVRNEDATKLSFAENSFNIVISNDVFEHVYDINKTFKELNRVLMQGGKLIFTIPFMLSKDSTYKRAQLEDDEIIYNDKPIYHGNPLSENGSLVFYDFGWDIVDIIKSHGFKEVYMLAYYSYFYGYLGSGLQYIFVAEK